ncbi:MAG: hypothetical protein VW983_06735 [Halieaceae bacterium]
MNSVISITGCQAGSEAGQGVGPRLAGLCISVLMGLAAVTASADPQSRAAELLDSVQGVRGIGDVVDKGNGGTGGGGGTEPPPDPEAEAQAFFETEMHPLVYPTCYLSCHQSGGLAGGSDLVLSGPGSNQIAANYTAFKNFITIFGSSSQLLTKISGGGHPGGVVYSTGSSGYQTIKTWTEFYD